MFAMIDSRVQTAAALVAVTVFAAGVAGCRVHVNKGQNGEEKQVQVDTPFGGVHVNTDQTTAADLGLPAYPGAELLKEDDDHKSADVHVGFGQWTLRVRAVSYTSLDPQPKVVDFYKKALSRYGSVLTCKDKQPVGEPKVTPEGLTCSDDDKGTNIQVNGHKNGVRGDTELELKAGSKHHQHIVGFEEPKSGKTRFALVALDLPNQTGNSKSD